MPLRSTMPLRSSHLTTLLLLLSLPAPAFAQVNVEILRGEAATDGFGGAVETSLELRRGNTELLDVGGTLHLRYQLLYEQAADEKPRLRRHTFVTTTYRFARQADTTFAHAAFAHLRWTEMWRPRIGAEAFLQYQYDELFRLSARALAGGGARFILLSTGPVDLALGAGAMVEYERIRVAAGAADDPETLGVRSTNYLSTAVQLLDGNLRLIHTAYIQPLITDPADLRFLNELQARFSLTERVAFGLSLRVLYDSRPPMAVESYDLTLNNTIQVRF